MLYLIYTEDTTGSLSRTIKSSSPVLKASRKSIVTDDVPESSEVVAGPSGMSTYQ